MTEGKTFSVHAQPAVNHRFGFSEDFQMSDGRDKDTSKKHTTHSGIQYSDVIHHPKRHPQDGQLYLAQQVTGHPGYGQVAPGAKKEVTKQSIKRENDDHGANGSDTPIAGNSPEEQRRAREAAGAKARADQSRL